MKDDIRESVFNLVGGWLPGKLAIDLFAGTGAVGLEALSRGALQAILIERHFPTAEIIRHNVAALGAGATASVVASDTFYWARQFLCDPPRDSPWAVFCSPPYAFYVERCVEMLALIESLFNAAPPDSVFVVESDGRFDARRLPQDDQWRTREYPPAVIHVWRPESRSVSPGG
jgi:16S rRNA (guanine966-N2)-methyltransferase